MNKKLLLFDAPMGFLTYPKFIYNNLNGLPLDDGYNILDFRCLYDMNHQRKFRFTKRGANEICSHCKTLGYDIVHYDFDARLIKKFGNISLYLDELTHFYASDDEFDIDYINPVCEMLFSEFNYDKDYEFLLCSLQRETFCCKYITEFQIRFTLSLLKYLKREYKNVNIIVGGDACAYTGDDLSAKPCLENSYITNLYSYKSDPFIDKIVIGSVSLDTMTNILEDESDTDHSINDYPDITYPSHKPVPISNIEDLRYSYKFIFNHFGFEIPDKKFENEYIQQAECKIVLGCVGQCGFCRTEHKVQLLPFEKTTDLLMSYMDQGYNSFFFLNDAINPIAEDLCNWISRNNIKIHWSDDTRHSYDKGYYDMLFESGCKILNFGCESFDNDLLRYIRKGVTSDKMLESLSLSHDSNVWNIINLIIRLPYSKPNDIDNSVRVVLENESIIDKILFNSFYISPGSPFHYFPKKFNLRVLPVKCLTGGYMYRELNGRGYNQILEEATINYYPKEFINKNYLIEVPQHLLFALYDIFKTKDKVKNWLIDNYYRKMGGDFKNIPPIL